MPDLATHALISYAGIRISGIICRKRFFSKPTVYLFVLGSVFPDLLDKTIPYAIYYLSSGTMSFAVSFFFLHTPIMLLLCIYIFSLLFAESFRKTVFLFVSAGVSLHLLLDLLQGNVCEEGYMWFFPFTVAKPMVMNIFYDDRTTYLVPIFLIFVIMVEIVHRKIKKLG